MAVDNPEHPKPLARPSDRKVAALLDARPEGPQDKTDEQVASEKESLEELALIFDLRDSRAFQWFEQECIHSRYMAARHALHDPNAEGDITTLRTRFLAVREIYIWLIEREIVHREAVNPDDEEIPRLRKRLDLL